MANDSIDTPSGAVSAKKNKSKSKWKKRIFHYSLIPFNIIFQMIVALAMVTFVFFYAPQKRDYFIQNSLKPFIEPYLDIDFDYKDLSFRRHGAVTLKGLKLYDKSGLFAAVDNIALDINVTSSFPDISLLEVDHIRLIRTPITEKKDNDKNKSDNVFGNIPPFIVKKIDLKKVTLSKEIIAPPSSFSLKGSLDSVKNQYHLHVKPITGHIIHADLKSHIISDKKIAFDGTFKMPAKLVSKFSERIPFEDMISANIKGTALIARDNHIHLDHYDISDEHIKLRGNGTFVLAGNGTLKRLKSKTSLMQGTADIHVHHHNGFFSVETDFDQFPLDDFLLEDDPIHHAVLYGKMNIQIGGKTPTAAGKIILDVATKLEDKKIPETSGRLIFSPQFTDNMMSFDMLAQFAKDQKPALNATVDIAPISHFGQQQTLDGTIKINIHPDALPKHIKSFSPVTSKTAAVEGTISGSFKEPSLKNVRLDIQGINYTRYKDDLPHIQETSLVMVGDVSKEGLTLSHADLKSKINNIPLSAHITGKSLFKKGQHDYHIILRDYNDNDQSVLDVSQAAYHQPIKVNKKIKNIPLSRLLHPMIKIPETFLSGYYDGAFDADNVVKSLSGDFAFDSQHNIEKERLNINIKGNIQKSVLNSDIHILNQNITIGTGNLTHALGDKKQKTSLKLVTELEKVAALSGQKMNQLSGQLKTSLTLRGQEITGFVTLDNGYFKNKKYGTALHDIIVDVRFEDNMLIFKNATANDNKKGTLSLDGALALNDYKRSDITLKANNFSVLNQGSLRAVTDTDLRLEGQGKKVLKGTANITEFLFLLPDLSASSPAALNITSIKDEKNDSEKSSFLDTLLDKISLDITSNIINTAKISGFGLDGTLGGDLKIKNTLRQPEVTGMIDIDRGDFELLSKEFTITKGGVFIKKNVPFFNLTATRSAGDVLITATMTGTVDDPNISFSASPSLPEDEIMSYILFDGPKTSISPIEALRITSALATISQGQSGVGGMTDVIGNTERALGLDKININSDDQNNVRFGAGKYLTDKLYFSVDHGGADNNTIISLRLRLKDTLVLKALMNPNARTQRENQSEIFLQYNKDY